MALRLCHGLIGAGLIVGSTVSAHSITLDAVQDFQDGLTGGWGAGSTFPNAPAVIPDLGPAGAGDFALQISTNGNPSGEGSRLVGLNSSSLWTGDYTAAGVTAITVDLSSPNNLPLNARFAVNGSGGRFVTTDVLVPAGTGVWNNYTFSLEAASLLASGGTDAAATLANVTELRLLHNPSPTHRGAVFGRTAPFPGFLNADNLTAVPEPGASLLLGLGSLAVLRRRQAWSGRPTGPRARGPENQRPREMTPQ